MIWYVEAGGYLRSLPGMAEESLAGGKTPGPKDAKLRDALLALISLGHKQADAQRMALEIAAEITPETTLEEILRKVLSGPN